MNDVTPSLSYDYEMASKIKKTFMKNCHATFEKKIQLYIY